MCSSKMGKLYDKERVVGCYKAKENFHQLLNKNKFSYHFDVFDVDNEVAYLELRNQHGQLISAGSGKGENFLIGAMAEAYEHYVLQMSAGEKYSLHSFLKVKQQSIFKYDYFVQSIYSNKLIATTKFYGKNNNYDIPVNYINPYFTNSHQDYDLEQLLSRYSSNLGTSIGIDFNEAYLHGLNEALERHYTSYLFEDLTNGAATHKWELYTGINYKKEQIEAKYGKVLTVVLQTNVGVTVALSLLIEHSGKQFIMTPIGGGCSYFPCLAVQRSYDELMQTLELYTDEEMAEDRFAKKILDQYRGFKSLINISKRDLEAICYSRISALPELQSLSVLEQVALIEEKLQNQNYTVLHRILEKNDYVCVVQIVIPGFERFHLIRSGQLVVPQSELKKVVA